VLNTTHSRDLFFVVLPQCDLQPEQDGKKQTVWDIAFKPDGTLMVAAIGKRLVVFDPNDGTVLKQKQGGSAHDRLPMFSGSPRF
jgi:hypothetical protein